MRYYVVFNENLKRYEPLAITSNKIEVKELFEKYKRAGYSHYVEVEKEKYNKINCGVEK